MKFALTALFLFSSLAYAQAVEENFVATFPTHVRLLSEDFLKPRVQEFILEEAFKPRMVYKIENWSYSFSDAVSKPTTDPSPILSPEMAQIQLTLMRQNYHRLGEGNFGKRVLYSVKEGVTEEANYQSAMTYYEPTLTMGSDNPIDRYNYQRDHDPVGMVSRQLLNGVKRAGVREFEPDAIRIVKYLFHLKR